MCRWTFQRSIAERKTFDPKWEVTMNLRDKAWELVKWKIMKAHLGYTDEEMKIFQESKRNEDVLSKAPALRKKTIVLEVVESHGCNSQHKVGDRLTFGAADGGEWFLN
jgi:hypothetical protein